jgi:hypothetical protein
VRCTDFKLWCEGVSCLARSLVGLLGQLQICGGYFLGRISLHRRFHKRLVRRRTLRQIRDGPENVVLVHCFLRCMDLTVRDCQLGSYGEPLDSICCFADTSGGGFLHRAGSFDGGSYRLVHLLRCLKCDIGFRRLDEVVRRVGGRFVCFGRLVGGNRFRRGCVRRCFGFLRKIV